MSSKDVKDVSKKPTSEAKRIVSNDQEKQRKEKIKTCIGEIAKELPPSTEHLDRKPVSSVDLSSSSLSLCGYLEMEITTLCG